MKKPRPTVLVLAVMTLTLVFAAADILVVKVQTTKLRNGPRYFAQAFLTLSAGAKLEKVSESEGWIHSSAIEIPKFNLLAMNKDMKTQASASEVVLAGKGFNKQVEDSYRAKHGEANFTGVEAMLQIKISLTQVEDFLRKGNLGEFRGVK
jgi:hypothetical protein